MVGLVMVHDISIVSDLIDVEAGVWRYAFVWSLFLT